MLKNKVANLEHRIYELTDSPDQLAKDLIQDVHLLMTVPYMDNLELGLDMIHTFQKSYPNSQYNSDLKDLEKEINDLLRKNSQLPIQNYSNTQARPYKNNKLVDQEIKVQFNVQISEKKSGFLNVELSVQNLSSSSVSNVWLKATLIDKSGSSYGITQDFFFNRLNPYELNTESLSWEYVQMDNVEGIVLKEMRYSKDRNSRMLQEHECVLGQGNVKIFLEF